RPRSGGTRRVRRDRGNWRDLSAGSGSGHEGRHGQAGGPDRGRQGGQRARALEAESRKLAPGRPDGGGKGPACDVVRFGGVVAMPRYRSRSPYGSSFYFGPGPISTALKALIVANAVLFFLQLLSPLLTELLGLHPDEVLRRGWVWQLVTYMFLHGGL